MAMEAAELARWTRFAAKGGIGKCTAICDCVAENADDLMFLKDDEITVLMQLTEPQGVYLGYCEGVVGRFSGSNVHFHSKLKKPVMAKRSSVTAQSRGKSPTPSQGFKAPSPMATDSPVPSLTGSRRTRVSLDKHVSASISAFDQASDPVAGPLGRSRASYGSSRSRGSIRQEQSDGEGARDRERVSSPPQAALSPPPHAPSPSTSTTGTLVDGSSPNSITRTSLLQTSPPRTAYSSPSYNSSRHASLLSSYSQATFNEDDAAENTASTASPRREPVSPPSSPLTTTPNASTRLPSPPSSTILDTSTSTHFDDNSRISLALSDGEVGIGLSLLQDLADGGSYDGWSDSDSDEQVMGRRGSVRRVGSKRRGSALGSRVVGLRAGERDTTRLGVWRKSIRESVISEGSKYSNSSEGDSDSGLGYEDTETGHGTGTGALDAEDELEADITQTQRAFLNLDAPPAPSSSFTNRNRNSGPRSPPSFTSSPSAQQLSFPPIAPLSPSRSRFITTPLPLPLSLPLPLPLSLQQTQIQGPAKGEDYEYEFPPPPTHTPRLSQHSFASSSFPMSPPPPPHDPLDDPPPAPAPPPSAPFPFTFPPPNDPDDDAHLERTRRPSLAPSAMSAASSSDWEGAAAADIYEDYRYSRYSVASARTTASASASARRGSASSKFSVAGAGAGVGGAGTGGGGGGGGEWSSVPPFVDDPEARSRADSGSRPSVDGQGQGQGRPSLDSVMGQTRPSLEHQHQQQHQPQVRTRSRSNATAGFSPLVGLVSSPPPPPPPQQLGETESRRTRPVGHMEMESLGGGSESDDVSVYTQSSVSMSMSMGGKPSPRADGSFGAGVGGSVPPSPLHHEFTRSRSSALGTGSGNRPAPLTFTDQHARSSQDQDQDQDQRQRHGQEKGKARSPLLHTTWGSPLSSPTPHITTHTQLASASAPLNGTRVTPPSSSASNTGFTGTGEGFSGIGSGMPASATYFPVLGGGGGGGGGGGNGNDTEDGGAAGGMASAMRHRIEVERKPSVAESVVEVREQEGMGMGVGMGRRIVVEDDEDEIVIGQDVSFGSSLGGGREGELEHGQGQEVDADVDVDVDESMDSTITMGSTRLGMGMALHDAPSISSSPEPEPEMVAMGRLAPLVVANPNRTPSLSEGEEENEKDALRKEVESVAPSTPLSQAQALPATTTTTSSPPPPPAYSTLRPPKSSPSPAPSHLRPSLSELRGIQPGQEQGQRRSLFLPHPNAPKAPSAHSPGPMYIAQQQPPVPQPHTQQTRGGVMQTLRMALAGQGPPQGPRGRGPTIYGIMSADLSAATGPVLVHFSLTPPPATAPPPGSVPSPVLPVPVPVPIIPALSVTGPLPQPQIVAPVPVQAVRRVGSMASLDAAAAEAERPPSGTGGVIPRANFFPKAGGVRPRSRSFSGFQSTTAEIRLPLRRSREEGSQPIEMPSASEIKRALSPIILSPASQLSSSPTKPSPLRISSPLSRTQENGPGSRPFRPTNSPLAQFSSSLPGQQPASAPSSPTHATANRTAQQLRQIASRSTLNDAPAQRPIPRNRTPLTGSSISDTASPPIQSSPVQNPEARARPSVDADAMSVHSTRSNLVSPPPTLGRQSSLRSKLSLPNLRRNLGRQDESSPSVRPDSPVVDSDTLQVQDMDFELVRPNIAQFQAARGSEDSGVMGRDGSVDARQDANFLRAASPAISLVVPRSPTVVSDSSSGIWQPVRASPQPRGAESESSMDAHRQRELKWMSIMGSVSPAQSRKNKKVKKLLFDGVPSSVRYLVWSHLTDGKARCVPGVYTQLGGRGRVPALADVAKDVQRCFADHPQLQSTQGPVLSLLQAYLTMVPDVQYTTGLTLIAGQLLLLAPEEDAFWIFVSIMDTHTRPYFYSTPTQLDVDASLFSRALESIDPSLAKKMFTDFAISPSSLCRPWFTSLFVGSLPPDYLNRVWDIFLFEGVPFLFRVALALVSCCRRQILDSTSADSVLGALLRPAAALLPSSPEALVTLALALKLKDDDIRKQRVKLEAQVKRQTQQAPRATPGSISLPRT